MILTSLGISMAGLLSHDVDTDDKPKAAYNPPDFFISSKRYKRQTHGHTYTHTGTYSDKHQAKL